LRVVSAGGLAALRGDDRRLAQALGTLVANALEHGDGPVLLSARSWAGRVRLEVADDGTGPTRPLNRLARGRRAGHGSRGRGLAIAARIARDHGGRLIREPGKGCRIALELPVASSSTGRDEGRFGVFGASLALARGRR
jgi:signal transduction histidine kinase